MSNDIRIGIIGAGSNCRRHHIPKLQAIDGVEVSMVANRTRESGQRIADEFNIPRVADSWDQIVNDPDIDAVVIGTWPYLHNPATMAAMERGKHVLCEARMATDSRAAKEMYQTSLKHPELVLQIVPYPETLHLDKTIVRLIDEGYLGRIVAVNWCMGPEQFRDGSPAISWRRNRIFSGNNIMTLGMYYETLLRWIGPAIRVSAMGKIFNPACSRSQEDTARFTDIPDHVNVLADMACGAQLHIQISGVTGFGTEPGAYLFGTDGTLKIAKGVLYGAQRGDNAFNNIEIPEADAGGWRVEEEFIGAIRGEESIRLTDPASGVSYMEFTDAVTMSMRSGKSVNLPFLR